MERDGKPVYLACLGVIGCMPVCVPNYSSFASITNYHEFSGLKQHKCYSSACQKSKTGLTGLKSRHQQGGVLSEFVGKNLFPWLLQCLDGHLHPLASGPLILSSKLAMVGQFSSHVSFWSLHYQTLTIVTSLSGHSWEDSRIHRCMWLSWAQLDNPGKVPHLKVIYHICKASFAM